MNPVVSCGFPCSYNAWPLSQSLAISISSHSMLPMVVVVLTLPLELSSAVVQENEYLTISGLCVHLGCFLGGWNTLFKMTGPCLSFGIEDKELLGSVTNALSLTLQVLVQRSVADWLGACFLFPLAIEGCPLSVCSSLGLCYEWYIDIRW